MRRFCRQHLHVALSTLLQLAMFRVCVSRTQGRDDQKNGARVCQRVDGRKLVGRDAIKFAKPTVITNILNGTFPAAGAAWKEAALKRRFAKDSITCKQLGGSCCFDFDGNQAIPDDKPINLASVFPRLGIQGDLPGNLFVLDHHPAVKRLVDTVVNDSSHEPVLTKALESLRTPRSTPLSFGREGQWNHIHRHEENLFLQMTGRKGWVMFPGKNIPKRYIKPDLPEVLNEEKQEGVFDQRSVCWYVMTCKRWANFAQDDPQVLCRPEALEEDKRTNAVSRYRGFTCELKQGEALFIPDGWWHGTCNLDHWNAGFTFISKSGRQDYTKSVKREL